MKETAMLIQFVFQTVIVAFRCGPKLQQQHRHKGRLLPPRLLTLLQIGGGKIECVFDEYGAQQQFDVFCKIVLRYETMNFVLNANAL